MSPYTPYLPEDFRLTGNANNLGTIELEERNRLFADRMRENQ